MIHINNHEITGVYSGSKDIVAVYKGLKLVWSKVQQGGPEEPTVPTILSCYYSGYWIDEYPWTEDTPWTD